MGRGFNTVVAATTIIGANVLIPTDEAHAVSQANVREDFASLVGAYKGLARQFVEPKLVIADGDTQVDCLTKDGDKESPYVGLGIAFFCRGATDRSDAVVFLDEVIEDGNMFSARSAGRVVVAHELGHVFDDQRRPQQVKDGWKVQVELHADCRAGQTAGILWPSRVDAMANVLYSLGDEKVGEVSVARSRNGKILSVEGYSHGLASEREGQFRRGASGESCGTIDSIPTIYSESVVRD